MLIRDINDCEEIIAGDKTILREFLHPDKQDINLRYSLAHAIVKVNEKSVPHKLKTSEVYYILEGKGLMHIENESQEVKPDQVVYIPPSKTQWIENIGDVDLKFLAIVDPAWRVEDEIVVD